MWSNDDREVTMYKQRKIYREIEHAIKHIESGDPARKELGLNLLRQALDDHAKSVRQSDKK